MNQRLPKKIKMVKGCSGFKEWSCSLGLGSGGKLKVYFYLVTISCLHNSRSITHLIYPIDEEGKEFVPEDEEEKLIREELLDSVKDMKEVLGLRCLSILRWICYTTTLSRHRCAGT